jgi:hypothetical protein
MGIDLPHPLLLMVHSIGLPLERIPLLLELYKCRPPNADVTFFVDSHTKGACKQQYCMSQNASRPLCTCFGVHGGADARLVIQRSVATAATGERNIL